MLKETRGVEIHTAFRNPGKGWLPYLFAPLTQPAQTHMTPLASSIYTNYIPWSTLEPTQGVFDWSAIDAVITQWRGSGRTLRFAVAGPNEPARYGGVEPFPAWIRALPGGYFEPKTPTIWQPDYRNATFKAMFTGLMTAFATRYYKSSSFAVGENDWREWMQAVDISIYGQYGEWHSTNFPWANAAEAEATLRGLIDVYFDVFDAARGTEPLPTFMMNVAGKNANGFGITLQQGDPLGTKYAIETRGAHMVRRNFGLNLGVTFWDDEPPYIAERLSTRSMTGEWGPSHGHIWFFKSGGAPRFYYTDEVIDNALDRGVSQLGWYRTLQTINCGSTSSVPIGVDTTKAPVVTSCTLYGGINSGTVNVSSPLQARTHPATGETLETYAQRRMGYRFHVASHVFPEVLSIGESFQLKQIWHQRAVAKLYTQHYLRARLVPITGGVVTVVLNRDPSSLQAHTWPIGPSSPIDVISAFTVPYGTEPGVYELQFAVTDAVGNPAMNLANSGKVTAGLGDPVNDYSWYRIGIVAVNP